MLDTATAHPSTTSYRPFTLGVTLASTESLYDEIPLGETRNPRFKYREPSPPGEAPSPRRSFHRRTSKRPLTGVSSWSRVSLRAKKDMFPSLPLLSLNPYSLHPDQLLERSSSIRRSIRSVRSSFQGIASFKSEGSFKKPKSLKGWDSFRKPRSIRRAGSFRKPGSFKKLGSLRGKSKSVKVSGYVLEDRYLTTASWRSLAKLDVKSIIAALPTRNKVFDKCPRIIQETDVVKGSWVHLRSLGLFLRPYLGYFTDSQFCVRLSFMPRTYALYHELVEGVGVIKCDVGVIDDVGGVIKCDVSVPKLTLCDHTYCGLSALSHSICLVSYLAQGECNPEQTPFI